MLTLREYRKLPLAPQVSTFVSDCTGNEPVNLIYGKKPAQKGLHSVVAEVFHSQPEKSENDE